MASKNRRENRKKRRRLARQESRDAAAKGEGGNSDLSTNAHLRRECQELKSRLQAGDVFTDDQVKFMMQRMGAIVVGGSNREAVAAYKVILAQAKLSSDLENKDRPAQHLHGHVHVNGEPEGISVFEIAADLGLSLSLEETGGDEGPIIGAEQFTRVDDGQDQ